MCCWRRQGRCRSSPARAPSTASGRPGSTSITCSSGATGPIVAGVNSAKCVDDNGNSSTPGTKVQMWDCNGGAAQSWTFPGDGTIRINGGCIDITGAGTANGTLVELWTCNGGANQQWQAE